MKEKVKMKKLLAILLVLMLLVSALAGCGNKNNPDINHETTNNQTENTEQPREVAKVSYHKAAENFAGGSGTEDDPFQISEAGHLVLLHEMLKKEEQETNFDDTYVKGYYILTADISLNDTSDFENWSTKAPQYGWEPIGARLSANSFAGVLDGNGHKITGMFMDADSGNQQAYYGLFAKMGGTVKNLTVDQSYICVSGGCVTVGTIAGSTSYSDEAVIENCQVSSEIRLYNDCEAGGIVGSASSSKVSGCGYSGAITQLDSAVSYIGGICASNGSIQGNPNGITDCTFTGTISGKGTGGGIVGAGDNVKNCVNQGSVCADIAGGIIGTLVTAGTDLEIEVPQLLVENCINEGDVSGTSLAGGIIGQVMVDESDIATSVVNCENKGTVNCDEAVAGIIGKLAVQRTGILKVENCTNHTDISSKGKTGGIICEFLGGINHQEGEVYISGCKNLGDITSEDQNSAGVVTYLLLMGEEVDIKLTLDSCTNEGAVKSTTYAGGILGFSNVGFNAEVSAENMNFSDSTKVLLNQCNNAGSVTTTAYNSMAGGVVGVLGLGYVPVEIVDCTNSGAVAIDFTLTDKEIKDLQGAEWPELYQIGGGVVGRIGDALQLTTAEGVETSADNVNAANGNIIVSGCSSTGTVSAPDYSYILNKWGKPLFVNYLGGIVGQCSATDGYGFSVENCTYSGVDRGLGNAECSDIGTKK